MLKNRKRTMVSLRNFAVAVVGALLLVGIAFPAAAANDEADVAFEDVHPGADGPGSVGQEPTESVSIVCPTHPDTGVEICTWADNTWNGWCYEAVSDQPSSADPLWDGHRDEAGNTDGVILDCAEKECVLTGSFMCPVERFWAAGASGEVSARVLAQRAVASMRLRAPQIGMTGGDPPDGMQIIGVPAWLWAADPGESTTGPITRTATEGAASVTATAVLDKTVWSMGDGVKVTCSGAKAAGTPWERRYGGDPSPTCGYTYQRTSAGQPDEAYTVTVRAYWTVTWSGGGQSGTIPVEVYRSIPKRVGEVQSILVPNPEPR